MLAAGADPNFRGLVSFELCCPNTGINEIFVNPQQLLFCAQVGQTPAQVARSSHAWDVLKVLEDKKNYVYPRNTIKELGVLDAGMAVLNGKYTRMLAASIPSGFRSVCEQQGWDTKKMWNQLNGPTNPWFKV